MQPEFLALLFKTVVAHPLTTSDRQQRLRTVHRVLNGHAKRFSKRVTLKDVETILSEFYDLDAAAELSAQSNNKLQRSKKGVPVSNEPDTAAIEKSTDNQNLELSAEKSSLPAPQDSEQQPTHETKPGRVLRTTRSRSNRAMDTSKRASSTTAVSTDVVESKPAETDDPNPESLSTTSSTPSPAVETGVLSENSTVSTSKPNTQNTPDSPTQRPANPRKRRRTARPDLVRSVSVSPPPSDSLDSNTDTDASDSSGLSDTNNEADDKNSTLNPKPTKIPARGPKTAKRATQKKSVEPVNTVSARVLRSAARKIGKEETSESSVKQESKKTSKAADSGRKQDTVKRDVKPRELKRGKRQTTDSTDPADSDADPALEIPETAAEPAASAVPQEESVTTAESASATTNNEPKPVPGRRGRPPRRARRR